jgi:hypothetical protein
MMTLGGGGGAGYRGGKIQGVPVTEIKSSSLAYFIGQTANVQNFVSNISLYPNVAASG